MDFEVRQIAQEPTGRADRGRRRRERSNRDARLKALHQLFQNEHRAGDWGIEGRREAGARPGCTKRSTISPGETKCTTDEDAYARAQLNARPFAPQGKTCADREDSADELDRRRAVGAGGSCPFSTASTWGIPLPAACRENRFTSQAAVSVAAAHTPTRSSNPTTGSSR